MNDDTAIPVWGHEGASTRHTIRLSTARSVLRTARAYAGLSQRELAERAGVSLAAIIRAEAGRSAPSWTTMTRCVEACRLRWALLDADDQAATDPIVAAPLVTAPDRGRRHYPAHLPVWAVERDTQWWDSHPLRRVPIPREEWPPYSFRRRHPDDQGKARWERG